ncbi:MAG: caspase family protein, partial [Chloroflexi bacterium]|nr:caspase family protein [Chloroflexota bacterium]
MSKRIALIIHNHSYHNPKLVRLKPPAADTATLAALLRNPAIGNFNVVETVINQPASELRRRIADLFHSKRRHDELLLYFVGHGLVDETGQLHLATVDTSLDMLAETAISAVYLTERMDLSFSRRQMLLLDCTYSCISILGRDRDPVSLVRPAEIFKGKGFGRAVLTTTNTIHYTLAENGMTSEATQAGFTGDLIQALQTGAADTDKDGQIGLDELIEYIGRHTKHSSRLQPCLRCYDNQDRFIIARNPHQFVPAQPIKWDLISGAILTPTTIIVIGGNADLRASVGLAGLFLLLYTLL